MSGPKEKMKTENVDLIPTSSQTVGPFYDLGLTGPNSCARIAPEGAGQKVPEGAGQNVPEGAAGERVTLICTVYDGEGTALPDAMVEIWQADSRGKYNHPDDPQDKPIDPEFRGFGRLSTDEFGSCIFETIKPGRVPSWTNVAQAPHLAISVFARGILKRLATRAYFAGDPANGEDPVLALVPQERRETLLMVRDPAHDSAAGRAWRFDIHLTGPQETVFFDV